MAVEVKVPDAGESITEVFVSRWLKDEGDPVRADEAVVEIESDKATLEVVSPVDGVLGPILKREGDAAAVGDVVTTVEEGATSDKSSEKARTSDESSGRESSDRSSSKTSSSVAAVMPGARRVLGEKGADPGAVHGSGPGGRILKEDAVAHVAAPPAGPEGAGERPEAATSGGSGPREIEVVPMSPMRRRIAERLVAAQQNAALLTTFNEIDMTAVKALRGRVQTALRGEARGQARLHVLLREGPR